MGQEEKALQVQEKMIQMHEAQEAEDEITNDVQTQTQPPTPATS